MNQEQYHSMMILAEHSDDGMVQELDSLGIPNDLLSTLCAEGYIKLYAVDGCVITDKGYNAIAEYRAAMQYGIEKKAAKRKKAMRIFWIVILITAVGVALSRLFWHLGEIVS